MLGGNHMLYSISRNKHLCYGYATVSKKRLRLSPLRFKQSYSFEHEEIKKLLQLPEILGLLKAQK
jgi:hypothetical protein